VSVRLPEGPRATPPAGADASSDVYHFLLISSWPRLLGALVVLYGTVNAFFALAYLMIGGIEGARPGSFADAFFFSVQTLATIGYGRMVPQSTVANALVSFEALIGLLGVAMVTGLVFAKFSRPTARVLFSHVAVIGRRDGIPSLMFRMANARGNNIVEAQLHVVLARDETTAEGEKVRRFYDLEMARRQNALFALSWTAIHPITESSPLHRVSPESLVATGFQLIVSIVGFDESFSQTVHARHAYGPDDVRWNARFADILTWTPDGRRIVDYSRFHDVVPVADAERRAGSAGML
jgi:inward rectifier potassium channel